VLEKSFQIIAGRYYEKALSLEREILSHIKKQYDCNPMNTRIGREFTLSADAGLQVAIATYKKYKNPREYFERPEGTDSRIESATQFFIDFLTEEQPFEKTMSASQRYGLLSVIYGNFNQVCEKLEKANIHPPEGEGLYFAALHRLGEEISNYSPEPQKNHEKGSGTNTVNAIHRKLAIAAKILDDFPKPNGDILEIPESYWDKLLKETNDGVLPSRGTKKDWKESCEWTLSDNYCDIPPKNEFIKIKIKLTKGPIP
jgi:hypothetical protein